MSDVLLPFARSLLGWLTLCVYERWRVGSLFTFKIRVKVRVIYAMTEMQLGWLVLGLWLELC